MTRHSAAITPLMQISPATNTVSVVMIGNFNPAIVTPQWLARHGVIPGESADRAEISVIHPQVCSFDLGWCSVHVDRGRYQAITADVPFIRMCDLTTKIFGELLPNTPVRALGVNRAVTFRAPSPQSRNAFGRRLAPPESWGEWGRNIAAGLDETDGKKSHGGMLSITMQQRPLDDRDDGWLNVKVELAPKLPDNSGIAVEVNDHYVIEAGNGDDALAYAQLLASKFDVSIERSDRIIDQLMEMAK